MSDPHFVPAPHVDLPDELAALRDELLSMAPARLVPVNAHVMFAAFRALGALPALEKLRPALVQLLGEPGVRSLNRLEHVARAAITAAADAAIARDAPDPARLASELRSLREILRAEVAILGQLGQLGDRCPPPPSRARGYEQLTTEVLALTSIVFDPAIAPHTRLEKELWSRAEGLVNELSTVVGASQSVQPPSPQEDLRQRAFSLLVETYDDVRRQMTYLRWKEKDVDELMPSLWDVGPVALHNAQRRRARKARRENGAS